MARCCAAAPCRRPSLTRQRGPRCSRMAFALERRSHRARSRRGRFSAAVVRGTSRGLTRPCAGTLGCSQPDSGATRLRKPDGNRLLGRSRAVFSLADVFDLFPNEFSSLGGWRLALRSIAPRALNRFLFRHRSSRHFACKKPTSFFLLRLGCSLHALGKLFAAGLAIPLLEGFGRDFPFDEELGELSALRLALERHLPQFGAQNSGLPRT